MGSRSVSTETFLAPPLQLETKRSVQKIKRIKKIKKQYLLSKWCLADVKHLTKKAFDCNVMLSVVLTKREHLLDK